MSEPASPSNFLSSWNTEHSPFVSIIGTNHVPSTAELKSLKAHLVHPEIELSRLETEIDRVQTLLSGLLSEKQKLKDYVEAHRALASPVRQIPPETLAEIFVECLPTAPSYPVRSLAEAPLILTIICRDWRRVALTTPRLWASLHLFLPLHLTIDACSRRLAGTALWLERSGSLPLSISFHGTSQSPSPFPPGMFGGYSVMPRGVDMANQTIAQDNMRLMIRLFMSFRDRIRDLVLSLSPVDFAIFDELSPDFFPSLVSLKVQNGNARASQNNPTVTSVSVNGSYSFAPQDDSTPFAPILSRMPSLRKLEINHFLVNVMGKNYLSLPCNWKKITNLVLDAPGPMPMTPLQGLAILTETPHMKSVSFRISLGDGVPQGSTVVHLNDLTEMRLSVSQRQVYQGQHQGLRVLDNAAMNRIFQTQVTSLIDRIQCPALRLFSFRSDSAESLVVSQWPFNGLPMHTLETLKLSLPLTSNAIWECVLHTPNLINFEFKTHWPKFPLQDTHLSHLTLSPSNSAPLWPHLQSIRILTLPHAHTNHSPFDSVIPFTSAALTTFLESRSQTLKSCDVFYHHEPEPSFSEAELNTLQNLKRDGLKLRLNYQAKPPNNDNRDSPDRGIHSQDSDMEGHYGKVVIL